MTCPAAGMLAYVSPLSGKLDLNLTCGLCGAAIEVKWNSGHPILLHRQDAPKSDLSSQLAYANKRRMDADAEVGRLQAIVHPWCGPCDAMGEGGDCSECAAIKKARGDTAATLRDRIEQALHDALHDADVISKARGEPMEPVEIASLILALLAPMIPSSAAVSSLACPPRTPERSS